jgi:hypothetical protein
MVAYESRSKWLKTTVDIYLNIAEAFLSDVHETLLSDTTSDNGTKHWKAIWPSPKAIINSNY